MDFARERGTGLCIWQSQQIASSNRSITLTVGPNRSGDCYCCRFCDFVTGSSQELYELFSDMRKVECAYLVFIYVHRYTGNTYGTGYQCLHYCTSSAVDPHSFFADPDPAVFINKDPDPDPAAFKMRTVPILIRIQL